ncbi:MAG: hypothetical protein FH756_06040 [Firmicutes bacterium]|nr:hypothetical protein [Bacillota bacterium]
MTRISTARARQLGLMSDGKKERKKCHKNMPEPMPTNARWNVEKLDTWTVITIPGELPSLNVWKQWHWAKYQEKLQELSNNLKLTALAFKVRKFHRPRVQVVYYFRTKRRRDPDNYAPKFILDALRYAGVIAEDNSEILELLPVEFEVDSVSPRVEVWVKER